MRTENLATIAEAKLQAVALRERLGAGSLSHGEALERVAQAHGFRDWNTFRARLDAVSPPPWSIGDRVKGRYLGHGFDGSILDVTQTREGWFRLTLQLDQAVDVVASAQFSNFRKRISATIGPAGTSREKTSDGAPQMVLGRHSD